jgi:hypothetical protein
MRVAHCVRIRRYTMHHGERGPSRLSNTTGHRVTWFGPDRPVGGGTISLRGSVDDAVEVDESDAAAAAVNSEVL